MHAMNYFICILFLALPVLSRAQLPDFRDVMRLPATVNSNVEESMPLRSPDGKTLYFARTLEPENKGGVYSGSDVWISRWDGSAGRWGKSTNLSEINTKGNNTIVGMNKDGTTLYLTDTWPGKSPKGIYFIKKISETWSRPELIRIPDLETASFLGVFVSPDFDVIFLSMKGQDGYGEEDLYVTTRDVSGHWSKPINLGATINTKGFEISPFLSADKKRLFFSSNGHPGLGDADIFYCDRLYDSWEVWSAPRNLGEHLNSKGFDAFFSLHGDSVAYFSSNRAGGLADIYSAKIAPQAVPVKEVAGRRYLSDKEIKDLFGSPLDLHFKREISDLSEGQKQTLGRINNTVLAKNEIRCALLALKNPETNDLEICKMRLLAILDQLKRSGIEGSRITFGIEPSEKMLPTDQETVRIRFYR
ncbi:MAG TPA: hypothetical protein VK517_04960 [Cyclobacteriaceae bacterium]|nr:hypothetical protein [Cyclobacteriaceae bacterium]